MRGVRGFTIIELVTTLAIASIIMGLAIYNFIDQIPHRQLRDASLTLVGELRLARQKAIAGGEDTTLSFPSASPKKYRSILGEQTLPQHVRFGIFDPKIPRHTNAKNSTIPDNGLVYKADKDGITTISARKDGTIESGTIYLTNEKEAAAIVVNFTGRINQLWWDGHAQKWR